MNPKNKINVPERISDEMRAVLQFQLQEGENIPITRDYPAQRKVYIHERKYWNEQGPEMMKTRSQRVTTDYGEVGVRLYYPGENSASVLFYLHGGGFILGNLDTHDRIMRLLANYSGCTVIGVDYSLSPEARFPQAIEETVAVCRFFKQHAEGYQLSMVNIGFAGDSAGAMLALASVLWLRDHDINCGQIKGVLLYYGLYGLQDSVSQRLYGGIWDGLTRQDLADYQQAYLASPADRESPYYCLFNNDLTRNMPPCFIVAAQFDPLIDDSVALYQTLREHRQPCHYQVYPGTLHAFLHYSRMMPSADLALRDGADFFRRQLLKD